MLKGIISKQEGCMGRENEDGCYLQFQMVVVVERKKEEN